jgi:hypothetical protein
LNGALDILECVNVDWIDRERKVVTVHVIKVCRGSKGITSLFLNLDTWWHYIAASFTLWLICSQGKERPITTEKETG